jgi:CRP-like cAMP-binding protein
MNDNLCPNKLPLFQIAEMEKFKPSDFLCTFFKEHEDDLVGCGPLQLYPSGTEIYREDAPAEVVYLIERGVIKISRIDLNGKETIVGLRSRYWLLAAPAVFLGMPYLYTATTVTPCHLRPITVKCFFHVLKTSEAFSQEMYRLLSQEVISNLRKVEEVSCMTAKERMKQFLRLLVAEVSPEKSQAHNPFQIPLKQYELAQIIGVSPEHLCRVVKELEREGVLTDTKGLLTIRDVK